MSMRDSESIQQHLSLYAEICFQNDEPRLPLHTSIVFFLLSYCEFNNVRVFLVSNRPVSTESWRRSRLPESLDVSYVSVEDVPRLVKGCRLPAAVDGTGQLCRAGLAVVLRHIINKTIEADPSKYNVLSLLGFKKTCLKACAEVSKWTRLCEIGLPSAVEEHLRNPTNPKHQLPSAIAMLERRLAEPVKVHNDDKIRRQKLKEQKQRNECPPVQREMNFESKLCQSSHGGDELELRAALANLSVASVPVFPSRENSEIRKVKTSDLPQLEHVFAEGLYFTLTDVVLLPCIHLYLVSRTLHAALCRSIQAEIRQQTFSLSDLALGDFLLRLEPLGKNNNSSKKDFYISSLQAHAANILHGLPHLLRWYSRVQQVPGVPRAAEDCGIRLSALQLSTTDQPAASEDDVPGPLMEQEEGQEMTEQLPFVGGPRPTMTKLKENSIEAVFTPHPCPAWTLPWDSLPEAINPTEGKMSNVRAVRKMQQLNNLVAMVTELAGPGNTVVDFCSGTGHVGIVLAHTLPDCQVVLIENKEESLVRAQKRSVKLGLKNIGFIQANLDYFTGQFHVGVALHACGIATDMVMEHCIQAQAAFVISPCCYGFIQNAVKFTFPKSKKFLETLTYKEHMILCRFADQTAVQLNPERRLIGKSCMGLVDLDRSWAAETHGYSVQVMTMEPESCSPKNNMLVGRRRREGKEVNSKLQD